MNKKTLNNIWIHAQKWLAVLFLTSYVLLQSPFVSAQALPQSDFNDIINNSPNYVGTYAQTCATGSVSKAAITGNNVKDAYNFFASNGYTAAQAAGIVGNLFYESGGVNPTQQEKGGGGGYGIAQFTGPELVNMRAWVTAKGEDPNSLQGQLDYLLYDLNTNEQGARNAVKATTTVADAAQAFLVKYERPADPAASLSQRINDAQSIFTQYGGGATGGGNGCTTAGSNSPNCATAVGDPRILCEAQKYAGIYYTFGGGHEGYAGFRAVCPLSSIPAQVKASTAADPGPCSTDCSALVSVAVDEAFGTTFMWTVAGTMDGPGGQSWSPISITSVQPGDIVTTSEHVEIVDHYDATTKKLYTFGSHHTGTTTGPTTASLGYYTAAYHWMGAGS